MQGYVVLPSEAQRHSTGLKECSAACNHAAKSPPKSNSEEVVMFARSVTMRIKLNAIGELNQVLEKEILPLLQKQKGFQDELTLVSSNGTEVVGISVWDKEEDAEAYQRSTYPDVQKILSKVSDGTPQVQTYEVSMSTLHRAAARHA
jgi:hypothetical protein